MLELSAVTKRFGGLVAVDRIDLRVEAESILGLIGPNGAGKTTLFSIIAGALRPDHGDIMFEGRSIAGLSPARICRHGLARTFQIPQPFASMTVGETILTAALLHDRAIAAARAAATAVAERVGLRGRESVPATALTNAEKKRLELARALGTRPRLLLLDEVMAGLNAAEVRGMLNLIRRLRGEGVAILLVEHNMEAVTSVCDRIVVLDSGRKIADGTPAEVMGNRDVIRAYLGDETGEGTPEESEAHA